MKASELMTMTYEQVEELEQQLWKDWYLANSVVKVLKKMKEEE